MLVLRESFHQGELVGLVFQVVLDSMLLQLLNLFPLLLVLLNLLRLWGKVLFKDIVFELFLSF